MRCLKLAGLVGIFFAAMGPVTVVRAQNSPGVLMAAFGGGNGDTWREMVGKPFGAASSIPVKIIDVPSTESAIRVSAGNPQYNVAWVPYFGAVTLYKEGLIELLDASDFPELKNVPEKYLLKSPDGKLLGVPVQFQYYAIAFNTSLAKASDFPSWLSLCDAKWKGKLASGLAASMANYDLAIYSHIAGGDEKNVAPGVPAMSAFIQNSLTTLTSFAQGNTLLSRGEVSALPFYSARIAALKKENAPVDITIPKEGAMMLPYMLVVPKAAKNREAYMAFLRYATLPETQLRMFNYSAYFPLNVSAKLPADSQQSLGMDLETLLSKLYSPDFWVQNERVKENVNLVEEVQARH